MNTRPTRYVGQVFTPAKPDAGINTRPTYYTCGPKLGSGGWI